MTRIRAFLAALSKEQQSAVTLVALNVPLVALILLRNLKGMDSGLLSLVYHAGLIIGWYMFPPLLVCILSTLVLAAKQRIACTMCITLLSFYLFYLLADSLVFSIYKFHIDFFWLGFLVQYFGGLGIPTIMILAAGIVLAAIVLAERKLCALTRHWRRSLWFLFAFPALSLLGLLSSQIIHLVAYEKGDYRITRSTSLLPVYFPLHSHHYAVRYGNRLGLIQSTSGHAEEENSHHPLHYPLAAIHRDPERHNPPPNIVMILLESWRADSMNDEISPHVAAFGRRSIVCQQHFSSGNSTIAGIFGLFFGIQPTYWEAIKASATKIDNPVLIDVLQEDGYDIGVYARSQFKRHKIADTIFRDIPIHQDFAGNSADAWDRDMTDQMLAFLDRHQDGKQPFFLFGFYKASHFSYFSDKAHTKFRPHAELYEAFMPGKKNPEPFLNDYRNSIFFDDDQVGRIIDALDASGTMDNTIVIISSDHAEEFNDNGANYWGHGSNFTQWQTRVPMILHLPRQKPRRITARTTHLDIVPTLLNNHLGVRNNVRDYSDGMNLMRKIPPLRPMVIASYVGHAFILGDNVFAIEALKVKSYKLEDITKRAEKMDTDQLRSVVHDFSRFYH